MNPFEPAAAHRARSDNETARAWPVGLPASFSNRTVLITFLLAACAFVPLYALLGETKPVADWRGLDIVGEGGTALMAAAWMWIVLASRPAGRVTLLLAAGLAMVALGAWADGLDEVFTMKAAAWRVDKWLESGLTPAGMLTLTLGLMGWRREQFQLSDHMQRRERLFREHRAFDRITELASTDYLRAQVALERAERPERPVAVLMLEIEGLSGLLHEHGRQDSVRALQCITHQLLLNLRNDDLLCRSAGDRFVVLLPGSTLADAQRSAAHLARMVALTAFHTASGQRVSLGLRTACALADGDTDAQLSALSRELEGTSRAPADAMGQGA